MGKTLGGINLCVGENIDVGHVFFFETVILQYNQISSQSSNFKLSHKIIHFLL